MIKFEKNKKYALSSTNVKRFCNENNLDIEEWVNKLEGITVDVVCPIMAKIEYNNQIYIQTPIMCKEVQ